MSLNLLDVNDFRERVRLQLFGSEPLASSQTYDFMSRLDTVLDELNGQPQIVLQSNKDAEKIGLDPRPID